LASGTGKEVAMHESLAAGSKTPFGHVLQRRPYTKIFTDIAAKWLCR
jgi:hypothetical protein